MIRNGISIVGTRRSNRRSRNWYRILRLAQPNNVILLTKKLSVQPTTLRYRLIIAGGTLTISMDTVGILGVVLLTFSTNEFGPCINLECLRCSVVTGESWMSPPATILLISRSPRLYMIWWRLCALLEFLTDHLFNSSFWLSTAVMNISSCRPLGMGSVSVVTMVVPEGQCSVGL